jgi:diadenosine tetraphosphate (Ap4A) HIT family hydrolase
MTINDTIRTFGYPKTLVGELDGWVVLLRPRQVTLGSLVLAAADEARAFGDLPPALYTGLGEAVRRVETVLKGTLECQKLNYLMLMMVDPHVHFHVIPRYAAPVSLGGRSFADAFWPKPPDITSALDVSAEEFEVLRQKLAAAFGR